jgi:quercetin dioxygenase-like cupin family protein
VDVDLLRAASSWLKRDAAPGVDGLTWRQYEQNLEANLVDLHARVHRGAYRALPSRRKFIPKEDGQRPLGVASLEDKIVQRAVVEACNAIYEEDCGARVSSARPKGRWPPRCGSWPTGINDHDVTVYWALQQHRESHLSSPLGPRGSALSSIGAAHMSTHNHRWPLMLNLGTTVTAAVLLCPLMARAQPPAMASGPHVVAKDLMHKDLIGAPGMEVVVSTVEIPPGHSSRPHRHNAQVFVYELQGTMIMQVKGGPRVTLRPGQMFYENPTDIHSVSANASKSKPAKFLAFLIKDKGQSGMVPVPPDQAQ